MSRHRQPGRSRIPRVSFHADARVLSRLPKALFVPSPFDTCNAIFALSQPFELPRVSPGLSTFDFTTKTTWILDDATCVFPRGSARVKPGATAFVCPLALLRPATLCVPCLSLSSCHACLNTSRPSMSRHRKPGPSRMLRLSFHADACLLSTLPEAFFLLSPFETFNAIFALSQPFELPRVSPR